MQLPVFRRNGHGTDRLVAFQLPLDYEWAIGIKGGIDFKNFSTTQNVNENVVVVADSTYPANINDNHTAVIKTTYLDFAPYLQYQFFRMGPFVQVGLDAGFLIANSLTQTRQLPEGTTIGGQTVTFTNGTLTETIQAGSTQVNSLRLGLLVSAGYNIQVSERSVFSPLITYDFPLTVAGSTGGSNWKIGSLYASALLKFQL